MAFEAMGRLFESDRAYWEMAWLGLASTSIRELRGTAAPA
jgi:hypothetical protein